MSDQVLAEMRGLLTADESRQQARYHFEDDRRRYLATRALVRVTLSEYLPQVAPAAWRFSANAYGRPAIAACHPEAARLRFNISHANGLIVLAVATDRELGVDVELVSARTASLDIADHFFSPCEVAALALVPEAQRQDRFFEYWTFKESYIKARGMGLSLPLDQFSFHFPAPESVRLEIDARLDDDPARWILRQYRPAPGYLLALCAERGDGAPLRVSMRRAVPIAGHGPFETPLGRRSAA